MSICWLSKNINYIAIEQDRILIEHWSCSKFFTVSHVPIELDVALENFVCHVLYIPLKCSFRGLKLFLLDRLFWRCLWPSITTDFFNILTGLVSLFSEWVFFRQKFIISPNVTWIREKNEVKGGSDLGRFEWFLVSPRNRTVNSG